MDPVVVVLVVVVVGAAVAWWLLRRRRETPMAEDEWTVPPGSSDQPAAPIDLGPQVLDRDALVNRNRAFDPSRWDNSPEGGGAVEDEAAEGDLPRFFDRDYLKQRERPDDSPSP